MSAIIIVFQNRETSAKIRSVLASHGFDHVTPVATGAAALLEMGKASGGVVICGYKLPDMYYKQLLECLPPYFEMLLVGKAELIQEADAGLLALATPFRASDLMGTVSMMLGQLERRQKKERRKPKQRTWQEENYIRNAKFLLMERNHLTEADAHRYIQKCSMDNGTNMVETAQMILRLMYEEV